MLDIDGIALAGLNKAFSLTEQYKISITVSQPTMESTNSVYDPATDSYIPISAGGTANTQTISDARMFTFSDEKIRNSNGTLTNKSKQILFRASELVFDPTDSDNFAVVGTSILGTVKSISKLPNELNPVFIVLIGETT